MNLDSRIYVAGHTGLVGSALVRRLKKAGYGNLKLIPSGALDLREQAAVESFFSREKPEYVFLAAAKVGGIYANNAYPAQFIYDNLMIAANVINASFRRGVRKLLFLGSSCIYPRLAAQPMKEDYLLTGPFEPTNEPYAVAKVAGIKLCEAYHRQYGADFISVMPANLYGPNDNFCLQDSHVLPALIRKFHEARERGDPEVEVWGSGKARREFLHVDDLAEACVFLMEHCHYDETGLIINVGSGEDLSIAELAEMIHDITGYRGAIRFNPAKPDGMPRKLLDISRINALGWKARIPLRDGLSEVYRWYKTYGVLDRGKNGGTFPCEKD
ncbi:MAG: GDP-L-fucose synthase family protein [Bacillota bacterium]